MAGASARRIRQRGGNNLLDVERLSVKEGGLDAIRRSSWYGVLFNCARAAIGVGALRWSS